MKRTCKTCASRDDYIQQCWRAEDDCPDNKPACEYWILSAGKLIKYMCASLDKAREKPPEFLDVWPKAEDAEHYETCAKYLKEEIAHKEVDQLRTVLYSEVNEFIAEVARGDLDRALEEAGDIMAVLYRTLNGDGKNEREEVK